MGWWWRRILNLVILLLGLGLLILPLERASLAPPPIVYQEAQEAEETDLATAQALYTRLSVELPPIGEYLLLASAKASLPAVEELQSIIAFRPHSPAAFEAHLALARHYDSQGDIEAESEYKEAMELDRPLALRLEFARWLEKRGRTQEAYQEYKAILSSHPVAFVDMRRTAADPLLLAADLNAARYFNDTLEVLRTMEEDEAIPLQASALYGLGRYEEAKTEYEAWLEMEPEDSEAHLGLARTLRGLGHVEEALEEYRKVEGPEGLLGQAELLESIAPEAALEIYQDHPYPYAWWRGATLLEQQGKTAEALPFYSRLARSDTGFADDAAYRMYVLAQRLGDTSASEEASTLLIGIEPNYLSLLASEEGFSPSLAPPFAPTGEAILEKAEALELLGLNDLAKRELLFASRFTESPALEWAMAEALMKRGYLSDAQAIAAETVKSLDAAPLSLWRLAYPKPYEEEVNQAAQEWGLDPLLIYAIIRVESRYDLEAISYAYAQGLMQIIPSTRDWIAEEMGIEVEPAEIFRPDLNIRLGAWYLRHLLDYFDGELEYALAAYNGGPSNVNSWKGSPLVRDKADFLRWIGFSETREYVPMVFLNYEVYGWLEQVEGE